MKKTAFSFGLSVCVVPLALAQSLTPSVVSAGGGTARTASMTLEWTTGEAVVRSVTSSRRLYTQGFHQPTLQVEKLSQPDESAELRWKITASPNPVTALLQVRISAPTDDGILVDLTDLSGRTLLSKPAPGTDATVDLNLVDLPSGLYLIQVRTAEGRRVKTHKIIKQ